MTFKYKTVAVVTLLLILLSVGSSVANYLVALQTTESQLKEQSLPLSIENIYTEIQKNIIEPNLVSSMMSNDTFLKEC